MNRPSPPPCREEEPLEGPLPAWRVAEIAKALGHPARIEILEQFSEARARTAQELVDHSPLAQSTVSEHLRILRDAEVLFARRVGPRTWYCLRRSVLRAFAAAVIDLADDSRRTQLGRLRALLGPDSAA